MTTRVNKRQPACSLVWLRRDLRLADHAALATALGLDGPIALAFVFDSKILDALMPASGRGPTDDRRVAFIHEALGEIAARLTRAGSHLIVHRGDPVDVIPALARRLGAGHVVFAHDDEPYARTRDAEVTRRLRESACTAISVKDQCVLERSEVLTGAGKPFSVFTPYKNAWLKRLTPDDIACRDTGTGKAPGPLPAAFARRLLPREALSAQDAKAMPPLAALGFSPGNLHALKIPLAESGAQTLIEDFLLRIGHYNVARDFPAVKGPSYLSVHLRFGTVSIRELVRHALAITRSRSKASGGADIWLSELIWREFYMQILYHHPHVVNRSFKPDYDAIRWEEGAKADALFEAWCRGETGYPLVDAGMRQLNATGYMHNRLRMVVASFLTKDLGIDWRRGEAYFARTLNDFDLSANNGGWQWAASTGCDAQPYFRIFNPITQSERFDQEGAFIRRYVPEIAGLDDRDIHAPWEAKPLALQGAGIVLGKTYPHPVVDHDEARKKTLRRFSVVKRNAG